MKGDLETLESMYKNNGFLKFDVSNTIVSISKDKDIFITIIVNDEVFKVSDVKLAGDLQKMNFLLEVSLIFLSMRYI